MKNCFIINGNRVTNCKWVPKNCGGGTTWVNVGKQVLDPTFKASTLITKLMPKVRHQLPTLFKSTSCCGCLCLAMSLMVLSILNPCQGYLMDREPIQTSGTYQLLFRQQWSLGRFLGSSCLILIVSDHALKPFPRCLGNFSRKNGCS